jgi:hypothetical protein
MSFMQKSDPFTILLIIGIALSFFYNPASGQECYSTLAVQIYASSGTPSLEGFLVSINGMDKQMTDSQGYASFRLSRAYSNGRLRVDATKNDHGTLYVGTSPAIIPCINASAGQAFEVYLEVHPA